MHRKTLLLTVMAVTSLLVLVAISAVTVFALLGDTATQTEAVEVAPVEVETVSQPEVLNPVLEYEHTGYEGKTGCSYSSKLQMTEAPAETVEDQSLAQVGP
jgi:hypothetical protein